MMNLKRMAFCVAMMVTVGTVAIPVTGVQAASKITVSKQTNSNCDISSGKLSYKNIGKNTCTVTGLSSKGKNVKVCNIPSTVTCNGKTYKVTSVANNAFSNCNNLKTITCNKPFKTVGSNCFGNATVKLCK